MDRETEPRVSLRLVIVREGGLEPPRPCGHWHLKPARLPFRHSRFECSRRLADITTVVGPVRKLSNVDVTLRLTSTRLHNEQLLGQVTNEFS